MRLKGDGTVPQQSLQVCPALPALKGHALVCFGRHDVPQCSCCIILHDNRMCTTLRSLFMECCVLPRHARGAPPL